MRFLISICLAALVSFSVAAADDISLTVYNDNFGLVKQVREVEFKKGIGEVRFDDVAALIDPTSVHISPKNGGISILEQNYQYDLVNTKAMMQRYLDTEISIITKGGEIHRGKLLSFDDRFAILQAESGEITITNTAEIVDYRFTKLPDGLVLKPTLVWLTESDRGQKSDCEVSYLTDGINWHAEYVAVVDKEDKNLSLSGWVSIDNKSGATYENASLQLVAGKVHRVTPRRPVYPPYPAADYFTMEKRVQGAPQFEEEAFFEYHLYTLTRPSTVADKETKQISLFPEATTSAAKVFTLDATLAYRWSRPEKPNVRVNLEFTNALENGLGMPLPKGVLRVYKADSKGELQFVGEDSVSHTPKDEKVRVFLGEAFDITAQRLKANHVDLGFDHGRETYEITLKNHKNVDIVVTVVEPLPGWREWRITESNIEYNKVSAYKVEFQVSVKAGGENKLTYTFEY
jgi:hypothetical protein